MQLSAIAFSEAVGNNENDLREAMRDIITRYGRAPEMGGYSADFLVDWAMQYWTLITHHFRNEVKIYKEELVEKLNFIGVCAKCNKLVRNVPYGIEKHYEEEHGLDVRNWDVDKRHHFELISDFKGQIREAING